MLRPFLCSLSPTAVIRKVQTAAAQAVDLCHNRGIPSLRNPPVHSKQEARLPFYLHCENKGSLIESGVGEPCRGSPRAGTTQSTQPAGGRKVRVISTKEDVCHIGILSPAFKKKKEDCSRTEQQRTNHCLQPKRNCHDFRLFCSFPMNFGKLSKTTFPNFLLKSNKSEPFLGLFELAYGLP